MALSQSVLSDLLDAFRSGEGVDLVRDAVRRSLSEGSISKLYPECDTGAVAERNTGD